MVGVSLGGNVLLKMAGEPKMDQRVLAIATVSAPIDLKAAQQRLMAPRNRLYHRYLLRRMKSDALAAADKKEQMIDSLRSVHTVYAYDDQIVAPLNGFAGAEDYYARCSAQSYLDQIHRPTLLVHAKTDPWIPARMYLERKWAGSNLSLVLSRDGGHVGFHNAYTATPWHDASIGAFMLSVVSS